MNLCRGMEIKVGGRYARIYSYTGAIGHIGEILSPYYTPTASLIQVGSSRWIIQHEDCIPVYIHSNKEALVLLKKGE